MSNNFHLQLYRGTTSQNNAYTGLAGEITADTEAGNIRLHNGTKAGGMIVASLPVGSIVPYAGTTIPDGYLLCDGSAISRTTYSALFAAIGTTYGTGDGNSTFNLPNTTDRFLEGNSSGYIEAGLPQHTHGETFQFSAFADGRPLYKLYNTTIGGGSVPAKSLTSSLNCTSAGVDNESDVLQTRNASNSIYGNSTTVQPPACKCYFVIKY